MSGHLHLWTGEQNSSILIIPKMLAVSVSMLTKLVVAIEAAGCSVTASLGGSSALILLACRGCSCQEKSKSNTEIDYCRKFSHTFRDSLRVALLLSSAAFSSL